MEEFTLNIRVQTEQCLRIEWKGLGAEHVSVLLLPLPSICLLQHQCCWAKASLS